LTGGPKAKPPCHQDGYGLLCHSKGAFRQRAKAAMGGVNLSAASLFANHVFAAVFLVSLA